MMIELDEREVDNVLKALRAYEYHSKRGLLRNVARKLDDPQACAEKMGRAKPVFEELDRLRAKFGDDSKVEAEI